MIAFEPVQGSTANISVGTSSASVQVQNASGANSVRIMNNASNTVFVAFGGSGVVASASVDIPLPAGAVEVFSIPATSAGTIYAAAIAPVGSGNIYFTPGEGI